MTAKLATVIQKETYLGHDIIVETFCPATANPSITGSVQTHHTSTISIWLDGEEIRDARETPSLLFVSREDAIVLGFEIGRMIVSQRRDSAATGLTARMCEFFKSTRLPFSSLRA
ncbi:DUF2158 domain-containing protein [Pseudomonas sp. IT-P12]|uniref:hypothetical protein n=1 Tax=Pseudomonas sp. IT-P12 TaxID=3026450 RepID=UPI0039E102D9